MASNNDPLLNPNSYVSFDATSISDLIVNRLNQGEIFTDQNYQGSNLSSLLDVISYTFSTLLFYLNKTSSESMFSEAQIYENMNRIVKLLNYNPKGKQSQSVAYNINASLGFGNYVIPRYSYIKIGATNYSFPKDIYFSSLENNVLEIQNPSTDTFLLQGNFVEYPVYTAIGNANEIAYLNVGDATYVDHNTINVYVKSAGTNTWTMWKQTQNLFLNKSTEEVFEVRYNPNQNYEIKFGDDINGKQLKTGDQVIIYYLKIDPTVGTLAANALNSTRVVLFNSSNYQNLLSDTQEFPAIVLNTSTLSNVNLTNDFPSNPYAAEESVDDIRKNAPKSFSYQQRLVTAFDFQNYVIDKFSNILNDCYVVNNENYLNGHIKYLYDIGIKSPQLDNTVLYNQIKFANSCNFNNVYLYLAPSNDYQKYVTPAQKEFILNDLESQKMMTANVVPMDPVYMLFDFYTSNQSNTPTVADAKNCILLVDKTPGTRQSDSGIINSIIEVFQNAFSNKNVGFGKSININQIASDILSLNGVQSIKTYRTDTGVSVNGLSFLIWNYVYPTLDLTIQSHNIPLGYFQYPIFNNISNLVNKIKVVDPTGAISITAY